MWDGPTLPRRSGLQVALARQSGTFRVRRELSKLPPTSPNRTLRARGILAPVEAARGFSSLQFLLKSEISGFGLEIGIEQGSRSQARVSSRNPGICVVEIPHVERNAVW